MTYNLTDVPEQIKERLGSEQTSSEISRINDINRIHNDGAIASLLYLLEVKQISAENFTKEIEEELEISNEKAKAIAREIKEKILQPIYYSLLNWGIDINDIDTEGAPTLEELARKETEFLESLGIKTETGNAPSMTAETREEMFRPEETEGKYQGEQSIKVHSVEPSKLESASKREIGTEEVGPLIIQKEEDSIKTTRDQVPSKSFSLPFGFFRKPTSGARSTEPAKARIEFLKESLQTEGVGETQGTEETPAEREGGGFFGTIGKIKKDIAGEQKKVVHYSELRTPITPFAKEEEFIDLESFGATPRTRGADDDDLTTQTTRISPEQREESGDVTISAIGNKQKKPKIDAAQIKMEREGDDDDKRATQTAQISPEQREESAKEEKKSPWKFSFIPKLWKKADTDDDKKTDATSTTNSKPEKPKMDAVQIKTEKANDDNTATQTTRTSSEQREEGANSEEGPKVEGNTVDLRSNY